MTTKIAGLLLIIILLSGCASQEFQGRNPKDADVEVANGMVTITIPLSTPYFRLENRSDDTVPYGEISFKFDKEQKSYFYRADEGDWQAIPAEESSIDIGRVSILIEEREIVVTYPSGTWAFP